MLKCVQTQIEYDKHVHNHNDIGVMAMHEDDSNDYQDGTYFDDISGESLDHNLTQQSRQEELSEMAERGDISSNDRGRGASDGRHNIRGNQVGRH